MTETQAVYNEITALMFEAGQAARGFGEHFVATPAYGDLEEKAWQLALRVGTTAPAGIEDTERLARLSALRIPTKLRLFADFLDRTMPRIGGADHRASMREAADIIDAARGAGTPTAPDEDTERESLRLACIKLDSALEVAAGAFQILASQTHIGNGSGDLVEEAKARRDYCEKHQQWACDDLLTARLIGPARARGAVSPPATLHHGDPK